jgi:hypothetical protein
MADERRDWDKELAEIDKLMGKAPPPAPPSAALPAARPKGAAHAPSAAPPVASASRGVSRGTALGTWSRAIAGAVLAGAMTQWPYAHGCGGGLLLFTLAAGAVVVAGLWGAGASWRNRSAAAHVLSLVVTGWGIGLIAAVVLPRIGYAAIAQSWLCP